MDAIDTAQGYEAVLTQAAVTQARKGNLVISNPRKCCWFCEKPTDDKRRWCDANCRDDWEAEQ